MSGTKGTKKGAGSGNPAESDQAEDEGTEGGAGGSEGADDQGEGNNDDGDEGELLKDPKKLLSMVKSLRSENAKSRTKNKELVSRLSSMEGKLGKLATALGGEEEDEESSDPVKRVEELGKRTEALELEIHMRDIARDHGIPAERDKYFRFLLAERLSALEEDEELSDEEIGSIAKEALAGVAPKKTATGVNGGNANGDGKRSPNDGGDVVTVQQFSEMNLGEKSALYVKNPELYQKLFSEAQTKGML